MIKPVFVFIKKSKDNINQYCLKNIDSKEILLEWRQTGAFENDELKIVLLDNDFPLKEELTLEKIIAHYNEGTLTDLVDNFINHISKHEYFEKIKFNVNFNTDKIYVYVHFGGGTNDQFNKARKIIQAQNKKSNVCLLSALSLTLRQPSGDNGFVFSNTIDKNKSTIDQNKSTEDINKSTVIIPTSISDWKNIVTIDDEEETTNNDRSTTLKAYEIETEKQKYIEFVSEVTSLLDAWVILCQAIYAAPKKAKRIFETVAFNRKDWWACGSCIEILKDWLSLDINTKSLYDYVINDSTIFEDIDFITCSDNLFKLKQNILNFIKKLDSNSKLLPIQDKESAITNLLKNIKEENERQ